MLELSLIIPAFIAGILTFLAPCTLPLVPAYLAAISGASLKGLQDSSNTALARRKIFLNGLFYVIGFSAVFIFFGAFFGLLGSQLGPARLWLARIGGILVILFGLSMLGALKIPLFQREAAVKLPQWLQGRGGLHSTLLGSAFAVGWTPCVGPILGSILLLASIKTTALQGAFLLLIFSMGLAIPFLLVALGVSRASRIIAKLGRGLQAVYIIGGLFLIGLGLLLFTNNMALLIAWGYQLLNFINYERLIDYL